MLRRNTSCVIITSILKFQKFLLTISILVYITNYCRQLWLCLQLKKNKCNKTKSIVLCCISRIMHYEAVQYTSHFVYDLKCLKIQNNYIKDNFVCYKCLSTEFHQQTYLVQRFCCTFVEEHFLY